MPKPLVIDVHAHHFGCDAPDSKLHRRGPGLPRLTVDSAGAFRVELDVAPGSYRARVPARGGYAEGVTAVLAVTG